MALSGGKGGSGGGGGKGSSNSRQDTRNITEVTTTNIGLEGSSGSVVNTGSGTVTMTDAGAVEAAFDFGDSIASRAFSTIGDSVGDALDFGDNALNMVSDISSANADLIQSNSDLARISLESSGALAIQANRGEGENIALSLTDSFKWGGLAIAVVAGIYAMKGK